MSKIDYSLGVTIFMQNCSFEAEISRDEIPDTVAEMDKSLTLQGVPEDNILRISCAMENAMIFSSQLMNEEIEQEDGISEIALDFVYAFVKQQGIEELNKIRGFVGCLAGGKLYINPCKDLETYSKAGTAMRETAQEAMGHDRFEDRTPKRPTIH